MPTHPLRLTPRCRYGHITEVAVFEDGSYSADKLYALGRVSSELAIALPDRRTVYITDDGTNVGFFKFVANVPGDLSAGRAACRLSTTICGDPGMH